MTAGRERLRTVPERRLRRGVYILPNLLTTGGLLCGFYSLVACMRGNFVVAAVAIMAANVFDVLDGRVARVTKSTSEFGSQYDSLADLVAFGVAPAFLLYRFALEPWQTLGWLVAALFVVFGALRLARFNVQRDDVAKTNFVGLPIPAAAEVIASSVLLYVYLFDAVPAVAGEAGRRAGWLVASGVTAALMVSGFKYFSFKELEMRNRQPFSVFVAVILTLLVFVAEPQLFLFVSAIGYAASGPLRSLVGLNEGRKGGGSKGGEDSSLTEDGDSSSVSSS